MVVLSGAPSDGLKVTPATVGGRKSGNAPVVGGVLKLPLPASLEGDECKTFMF